MAKSGLNEGRMGGNFAKSSQNAPSDFFKVNKYVSLGPLALERCSLSL